MKAIFGIWMIVLLTLNLFLPTFAEAKKLLPKEGEAGDLFGYSVSVSDHGGYPINATAIIGSPGDDTDNGENSGSAYLFTRNKIWWAQEPPFTTEPTFTAPDGEAWDRFGFSVSVSEDGDTVVIGAPGKDDNGTNSGAAYVFRSEEFEEKLAGFKS